MYKIGFVCALFNSIVRTICGVYTLRDNLPPQNIVKIK